MATTDQGDQTAVRTADMIVHPGAPAIGQRPPWTPGQKTRGRKARNAERPAAAKRALKLSVEPDTYERLVIHAHKAALTISQLVDKLAGEHCNDWCLHAKPGRKPEPKD